ncbi:NAD(P)-dependent oxidoreductase [Desulfogranum mediterraneum]|uniref:NAD(P)-dependent oxidoreductase n=1 Tax=Desulfogranum mediterraneum TaxID=160661 RepID=UPI0004073E72|nr:NAD(P)-dependent oxidoreductase [Desulfogranum mediterraneum]
MKIGFIGLGHLGKAIAGRLIDCEHQLTVWNRTPAKAEGLQATLGQSPATVVEAAEIIFLCMFDSAAVQAVLSAEDGVLAGDVRGKIVVDLTTNHFREVESNHRLCRAAGATYLEAPVLGSVVPATQGALTVLVSGEEEGFSRSKPVLEDIGQHLFFLGEPGLATKMKLINNLTLGSFMATLAEAISFGEDVGIDRAEVLDILSVGGGNSLVLNAKKEKLRSGDFSTHFSSALIYKDLHCLQDLAFSQKRALFTGAVAKELYARTFEEGIDQLDFSAVYQLFKK